MAIVGENLVTNSTDLLVSHSKIWGDMAVPSVSQGLCIDYNYLGYRCSLLSALGYHTGPEENMT